MNSWCKPSDIIAFTVIVGALILMFFRACNSSCDLILISVVAFYFGLNSEIKN
jgi:hypothetical protein